MAAQPARPWFRLSSMARPAGAPTPAPPLAPAPAPAPAPVATPAPAPLVRPTVRPLAPPPAESTPPPPAPLVRPTLRPLAPSPAEPTPQPAAAPTPTPPAAAVPTPTPPAAALPTPTPPAPLVRPTLRPLAPPPAEPTPPTPATRAPTPSSAAIAPPPSVVTSTTAAVPLSPARGVTSAPSAASPPATAIAITSTSSSVPPSPGNKVAPIPSSGMPSPRTTVTTSVPTFPAISRAVPPPQTSPPKPTATANSVPYSPPKPRSTTISLASTAREPNPNDKPSLRTIRPANHTPPESPNRIKPTAPPPSPLNLPASQLKSRTADQTDQRIPLEAEQKTVLVQKTIDQKSNSWFGTGGSKQDRESGKPGTHAHIAKQEDKIIRKKLSSDSEEAPGMRVITLAGENKGAHMELIRSPNKHHEQRGEHSHYLYKKGNNGKSTQTIGNHESDKSYSSSSSSGEEGKAKMKDKIHHRGNKAGHSSQLPLSSFTNSNVQGVNNSIMYNTSCTHHDPGVHIALARKPNGDGFDVKSHVNGRNS